MAAQRLYGVFWHREDGIAMWGLHRNGRQARKIAKARKGELASMPLPSSGGPWDATTFRHCADRYEDFRER